ncbi:hypothetical protein [Rhodococcus koreensis]
MSVRMPAAAAELLDPIVSIGKKRGAGDGHILSWEITEHPAGRPVGVHAPAPRRHTWPHRTASCLHERGDVRTGGEGRMDLRPPYMHRSRRTPVLLPAT